MTFFGPPCIVQGGPKRYTILVSYLFLVASVTNHFVKDIVLLM